ncbi:MAG: hypothetical protein K2X35_08430 [Bryobacteraceae bacterium]|nr:hypothetical protein [Bryobacteraceae bacterium]
MGRYFIWGIAAAGAFGATAFVLTRVMPGPLRDSDYVVIGTLGTLAALVVLFFGLIRTSPKASEIFFKRRK